MMGRMKAGLVGVTLAALVALAASPVGAAEDGRALADKANKSDKVADWLAEFKMVLQPKSGAARERVGKLRTKLQTNGEDSSRLFRFSAPADVKGTGVLMVEHSKGDDEQFVYLPAMKKSRRLAASGRSESFVGSDFAYGDVTALKIDDFTHTITGSEAVDGAECAILETVSKDDKVKRDTGYTKLKTWVRKDNNVIIKVDYYDTKGVLFKRQIASDLMQGDPQKNKWIVRKRVMENLQTGHKSIMTFTDVKVNQGLPEDLFTVRALEKE